MKVIREISEAEMIGEFLQAEYKSSRFRNGSLRALEMLGLHEDLIEDPDYKDVSQNNNRAQVLGLCRGWPDKNLFVKFPKKITWFMASMTQEEVQNAYRLKSLPEMTEHDRLLSATAERFMAGSPIRNVDPAVVGQIKAKIEESATLPPIIFVSTAYTDKKVLIEGHSRSIAYSSVEKKYVPQGITVIIGINDKIANWAYY